MFWKKNFFLCQKLLPQLIQHFFTCRWQNIDLADERETQYLFGTIPVEGVPASRFRPVLSEA